jgi:GTP-binding protein LepA|tara:strand:+ start:746 stop:2551 length:1806 start_codon:yes stop_codon:yes gene_type:complete
LNNSNKRNFCIIAHIDHGKSTLADRLIEITETLSSTQLESQVLDDMDIEKERGITIKSHPIQMEYNHKNGEKYILNLIDTPGHVDFTYEVSRSMAACEGALLIIDATQGIEAQTVSNLYLAIEADLTVIPILNKIDMPNADVENVSEQIVELIGCKKEEILHISAKEGLGINAVFDSIIDFVPPPTDKYNNGTSRGLIFDSFYDKFRGVVAYIRVFGGSFKRDNSVKLISNKLGFEITEVGKLKLDKVKTDVIENGDVGYVVTSLKDVSEINVGDTISLKDEKEAEALPGYKEVKPMVFSGMYPIDSQDYEDFKVSLLKLKLNDAALTFEPNVSTALGFGFRCGFLGPLHMEIVQERLEREFNMDLISTAPNVSYNIVTRSKENIIVKNPADMPNPGNIDFIEEPYIRAEIITPDEFIGNIMKLCIDKRGEFQSTTYLSQKKVQIIFIIPLGEVIYDFFEKLKSSTRGYASLDYDFVKPRKSNLVKVDIKINNEIVDALSMIVHKDNDYQCGSKICKQLKKEITRHQFEIPIQASIGAKIIARETIKALRKNVTAKCYGGDISRKRKLLEKQKKGKKRMKVVGNVELPQSAFLSILKTGDD